MIKRKTFGVIQGSVLYILFFAIGLGRIRKSFDHLPVDPGYEFFEDTYKYGISALVKTEGGYLDIPRRIIAEVVTLFPIRHTGNVGSMIWLLMVSATAVFIAAMVKRIHPSKALAIACGACVILAPSASESQIGNQSVVKWFLMLIAIIVVSLPEEHQLSARTTAILVLLSGLSNPMTFLATLPLGLSLLQRKLNLRDSRTKLILGAFIIGFVIQLISWKTTGVGIQKYDSRTYALWPGAGAFWYYNLIIPPLTCAAFVMRAMLPEWSWCPKPSRFILNLSLTGLVLFVVTYVLSGIGDRYFVVPQMLAFIVVAVYTAQHFEGTKFILRAALAVSIAIFCRASVKWYDAGWFLSDGPKWSEQVDLARSRCEVDSTQIIQLEQALGNTELPCSAILARS
jgi:hypothetical protein